MGNSSTHRHSFVENLTKFLAVFLTRIQLHLKGINFEGLCIIATVATTVSRISHGGGVCIAITLLLLRRLEVPKNLL
jgi:hypothetical protein